MRLSSDPTLSLAAVTDELQATWAVEESASSPQPLPAPGLHGSPRVIRLRKGLDLPISGQPRQEIDSAASVRTAAVVATDFVGLRPRLAVAEGDRVRLGQPLFFDKRQPRIAFTSPAAGRVTAIHRGARRALLSVVIDIDGNDCEHFKEHSAQDLHQLDPNSVREQLLASGLWTALRARPFGQVAAPDADPSSIFVTAIDTHPLSAHPAVVLAERLEDFYHGLMVLGRLANVPIYLCTGADEWSKLFSADTPGRATATDDPAGLAAVVPVQFRGPHPAGLPGTHIHFLHPAGRGKQVWHVNYQDVIAIGRLFTTGRLDLERVVALAGPSVSNPRLVRTFVGANLADLAAEELLPGDHRIVSGSVLGGRKADDPVAFLGRYHLQVSVLPEGRRRELFGWILPGFRKFSIKNVFASRLLGPSRLPLTTATHGSRRAIVPVGAYERVMPLDLLPTFLLRALAVGDLEQAEALGCLELEEEDLALCSFVCPGKGDYGALLREALTTIEREG